MVVRQFFPLMDANSPEQEHCDAGTFSHRADRSITSQHTTAPHRKNPAQSKRENSQQPDRSAEQNNPVQQLINQAVDSLIQQLKAGRSDALTAYLTAMGRFHNYSFGNILEIARQRAVT